ncbi:MAG: hypothetical protein K2M46_04160 [Lachnospiraceae bacterium]|nr:hypothetical protein [Lachnospiraceae bacterium]
MEDLIDIRNRKEHTNIVKWYNYNYETKKNIIGEEGNEIYLPLPEEKMEETTSELLTEEQTAEKDSVSSDAEDVLSRINQARDDKVQAAIMQGMET